MHATAHFIHDRARTLAFEAKRFPETAATTVSWLRHAVAWAEQRGLSWLAKDVVAFMWGINDALQAASKKG